MRIVLTDTWSWPDVRRGGERYLHELAAALKRDGQSVRILTTSRQVGADEVLGVRVRRLRQRALPLVERPAWSIEDVFGLQALAHLAGARLDVWHATSLPDAAGAALLGRARRGVRSVFTDHGYPVRASRNKRPDRRLQDFVARHIDAYVCVSRAAAQWLHDDYGREATVVPPGVDLSRWSPQPREVRPTLLYSGALDEPRKNIALLLEAVERLRERVPDLQMWLSGPGKPPSPLPQFVTRVGEVDDDELATQYARAWATVLPSIAEVFGLAVVESLASGTPVVVLESSGGPAEILGPHRRAGVVCGPEAEALADGCLAAFELAMQADTVSACLAVAQPYDWRHVVGRLTAVYAAAS